MKFEEALQEMRSGKTIDHPMLSEPINLNNVYKYAGISWACLMSEDWKIIEEELIEKECSYCDLFIHGKENFKEHISFHEKRSHEKKNEKPQLCEHGNINNGSHYCLYCLGWCEHANKFDNCRICKKDIEEKHNKSSGIKCYQCNKQISLKENEPFLFAYGTNFCGHHCKKQYEYDFNSITTLNEKINMIFEQLSKFEKRLDYFERVLGMPSSSYK